MTRLGRAAHSFGSFWWDFLIGDSPELFVAVVVIIVAALLLRGHHAAAVVVLPALAVVSLLASVLRGRRTYRFENDGAATAPAVEAPVRLQGELPVRNPLDQE
jgi:hypothetical protein